MFPPDFRTLKGDIFGGVTAAVVALPLALAFGVASGLGPIAGLYGAIAVGFFAAVCGGTPSQVSGPTGPMAVVMAAVVAQYSGSLAEAFAIVFLGGAIQVGFGLLRVGQYVSYTPYSVVSGFMSGVGIIIILIQGLPFFGLESIGGPMDSVSAWPRIPGEFNFSAFMVALASLAIMVFWPKRLRAVLPAPLAALITGTVLGLTLFPGAPTIGTVPTGLPELSIPWFPLEHLTHVLQAALILALIGSIDSLLVSLVADSMTRTRHNSNRELIGQGIGNMVAGMIGGVPGTGAAMRTVINIRAGGRTRLSGILHALILLGTLLGLGPLAEQIPHAVLAGILVKVGWDIIDWGYLRRIARAPRDKVMVMLVTVALTVFVDLITAVTVGIVLASFVTARWQEQEQMDGITTLALADGDNPLTPSERTTLRKANGKVAVVFLRGSFSYASARQLAARVGADAAGHKAVVYDFTEATRIDTSAALAVEELIEQAQEAHEGCFIAGLSGPALDTLESLGTLELLPASHCFDQRSAAVNAAVAYALKEEGRPADEMAGRPETA